MKEFQAVARVYLQDGPANPLSEHVSQRIGELERKAAAIRRAGGNPRRELRAEVDSLIDEAAIGTIELEQHYQEQLSNIQAEYKRELDRRPTERLAKIEAARAEIDMLTDAEVVQRATDYNNNPGVIDEYEGKMIAGRLAKVDPVILANFKEIANEHHVFQPYLQDPDNLKIAQDLELVKTTKPGNVAFTADGATMQLDIESLIDFDGELTR